MLVRNRVVLSLTLVLGLVAWGCDDGASDPPTDTATADSDMGDGSDTVQPECTTGAECPFGACEGGMCVAAPACDDLAQNGDETDVDCGGATCAPCAEGEGCAADTDCAVGACADGTCAMPTCTDEVENQDETGVDCGGATCGACPNGEGCLGASDCISTTCSAGVCVDPSCTDGLLGGTETDVDCGGADCAGCLEGQVCIFADDCANGACDDGICAAPACGDGVRQANEGCDDGNGDNTDACPDGEGGSCEPATCGDGFAQSSVEACDDGNAIEDDFCLADCTETTCADGLRNGDEGDADCGGRCTTLCTLGQRCGSSADCADGHCSFGVCGPPVSCADHFAAGATSDGVYAIDPDGNGAVDVYCDMTSDGGGWTLVGSSTGSALNDQAAAWYDDLATLTPTMANPGLWDGMRSRLTNGNTDIRFTCRQDPAGATNDVDLSFYDTDWYGAITVGDDTASCFFMTSGGTIAALPPARRDNVANVDLPAGDDWEIPFEGEDNCNDSGDFTVDFDDAGMDRNQSDGTDWGEDDNSLKCGVDNLSDGAWFVWVREPTCLDGVRNQGESDIDCGGAFCGACAPTRSCNGDSDCASNLCVDGLCTELHCTNGTPDANETGLDCGGPDCLPCDPGQACATALDCASTVCDGNVCGDAPTSCLRWLDRDPASPDGTYVVSPDGATYRDVRCDMTTDGGGWTLVAANRGAAPSDGAESWHPDLATLDPSGGSPGIWAAYRPLTQSASDLRFTCRGDVSPGAANTVDLAVYDADWYLTLTSGAESAVCFTDAGAEAPARSDLISGETRPAGDVWNQTFAGEDACDAPDDFTVDFDDAGMNGDERDGTDWGVDDDVLKCGTDGLADGVWQVWFREAETCGDGILNQDETDVDCGGLACAGCAPKAACAVDTDCADGYCSAGTCYADTCLDGQPTPGETDLDCGGPACGPCSWDQTCGAAEDCTTGLCDLAGTGVCIYADSCAAILGAWALAPSGDYPLAPNGDVYACDMATDGGGWTRIVAWDRETAGQSYTELEAQMVVGVNLMGNYLDETTSLRWSDADASYDPLQMSHAVAIPNAGESILDFHYLGTSMEVSGTWFWASTAAGDENLRCWDDASPYTTTYAASALSWIPGYACPNDNPVLTTLTWTWDEAVQSAHAGPVTAFGFTSLHGDSGFGDRSDLYRLNFWVR